MKKKWKLNDLCSNEIFWMVIVCIIIIGCICIGYFSNRFDNRFQRCLSEEIAMGLIQEEFPAPIAEQIQFEYDVGNYDIYMLSFDHSFTFLTIHFGHTKYDCTNDSNDLRIEFDYNSYHRKWYIHDFEWSNYNDYDNYPMISTT